MSHDNPIKKEPARQKENPHVESRRRIPGVACWIMALLLCGCQSPHVGVLQDGAQSDEAMNRQAEFEYLAALDVIRQRRAGNHDLLFKLKP